MPGTTSDSYETLKAEWWISVQVRMIAAIMAKRNDINQMEKKHQHQLSDSAFYSYKLRKNKQTKNKIIRVQHLAIEIWVSCNGSCTERTFVLFCVWFISSGYGNKSTRNDWICCFCAIGISQDVSGHSFHEVFSWNILEAMLLRCPVLTSHLTVVFISVWHGRNDCPRRDFTKNFGLIHWTIWPSPLYALCDWVDICTQTTYQPI